MNTQVTDPEPPDGGSGGLLLEDIHSEPRIGAGIDRHA